MRVLLAFRVRGACSFPTILAQTGWHLHISRPGRAFSDVVDTLKGIESQSGLTSSRAAAADLGKREYIVAWQAGQVLAWSVFIWWFG